MCHHPSLAIATVKPADTRLPLPPASVHNSLKVDVDSSKGNAQQTSLPIRDSYNSNQILIEPDVNCDIFINGLLSQATDESGLPLDLSARICNVYSLDLIAAQLPGLPHSQESAIRCYYKHCFILPNFPPQPLLNRPDVASTAPTPETNQPLLKPNKTRGPSICLRALAASRHTTFSNLETYLQIHERFEQVTLGIPVEFASVNPLLPPELLQMLASICSE